MRSRRLLAGVVVLALAGCGGTDAGSGPRPERTTGDAGAATTPLEEDRAYLLAFDFCANAPLESISLIQGGSPEELARDFAGRIRPELREAALQGCLAALERRG